MSLPSLLRSYSNTGTITKQLILKGQYGIIEAILSFYVNKQNIHKVAVNTVVARMETWLSFNKI